MKMPTFSVVRLNMSVLLALFATEAAVAQAPTLTTLTPARNTIAATRNTNVAALFSQPLPPGATLRVFSQQAGGRKAGTTAISSNIITFDPASDFKPGETLTATLVTNVANTPHVWQFTAAATGGSGTFGPGIATSASTGNIEVGDLDNDGDLDVLSVTTQAVNIYRNTGTGQLVANGTISINNLIGIKLADVDGDGNLDVLATNVDITTIRCQATLYRNNSAGSFTQGASTDISNTSQFLSRIATGDVDGDGDLDLLYSLTAATNQLVVHLNNGLGVFGAPFSQTVVNSTVRTVQHLLGDVDNDGDLDVISIANDGSGGPSIYLNNGTGVFAAPVSYRASNYSGGIAIGDIDNDGDLDLAVPTFEPNSVVNILINNGSGIFAAGPAIAAGSAATTIALGDLNGDGKLDMAVAGNQISILLNGGNGTFSANPLVTLSNTQQDPIILVDIDGDGDLDITTKGGSTIYISLNQNIVTSTRVSSETAFQAWPNPAAASAHLYLTLPAPVSTAKVRLHTLLGQSVREHVFSGSATELPIAGLAKGIYLLTVQPLGQQPTTRRVVIE